MSKETFNFLIILRSFATLSSTKNGDFSSYRGYIYINMHYAAGRKVAGSSPDEVDFFQLT
jgi:hypothetical protein